VVFSNIFLFFLQDLGFLSLMKVFLLI
jgi:hypothetical protein